MHLLLATLIASPGIPQHGGEPQYVNGATHIFVQIIIIPRTPPDAPTRANCGDTSYPAYFDATDVAYLEAHVLACWDGVTDFVYRIVFGPTEGDPFVDGDTVTWQLEYRVAAFGVSFSTTTKVTLTETWLQVGDAVECNWTFVDFTLDRSNEFQGYSGDEAMVSNLRFLPGSSSYSGLPGLGSAVQIIRIKEDCHQG